jgi:hypothetical protein
MQTQSMTMITLIVPIVGIAIVILTIVLWKSFSGSDKDNDG